MKETISAPICIKCGIVKDCPVGSKEQSICNHQFESEKQTWEKEFEDKFNKKPIYADYKKKPLKDNTYWNRETFYCLTCNRFVLEEGCICGLINYEDVKEFIEKTLKSQRHSLIEEIIEKVRKLKNNSMKESDFDAVPNKRGIWYGGFAEAKRRVIETIKRLREYETGNN